MPIRVNLKEIFPSDPQEINVEKLNFNFNKLLELGVGSPGPIGLTGPQGPAGPIGLVGPQGDRGATWWVDAGDPNTITFSEPLMDGDMYLDQTSNVFQIYQYDALTSTWNTVVSIAAIVNSYLSSVAPSPFTTGPTGIPASNTKFVVFNNGDQADPYLDYVNDGTRGAFNASNNKALFLSNFDENILDANIPNLSWPANQNSLYNSLFKIVTAHDDAQASVKADLGRYHLEFGSLYNDGTNILLSDLKHNLKGKFFKRYLTSPELAATNEWINTARFSLSLPEPFIAPDVDQNGEFEFVVPKYNAESSLVREEVFVRIGSAEAFEERTNKAAILADGISITNDQVGRSMVVGLREDLGAVLDLPYSSTNFALFDVSDDVDGLFFNKTLVQTGGNFNQIITTSLTVLDTENTISNITTGHYMNQGIIVGSNTILISSGAGNTTSNSSTGLIARYDVSNPNSLYRIDEIAGVRSTAAATAPYVRDQHGDRVAYNGVIPISPNIGLIKDISEFGKYFIGILGDSPSGSSANFMVGEIDSFLNDSLIISTSTFSETLDGYRVQVNGSVAWVITNTTTVTGPQLSSGSPTYARLTAINISNPELPVFGDSYLETQPGTKYLDFKIADNKAYVLRYTNYVDVSTPANSKHSLDLLTFDISRPYNFSTLQIDDYDFLSGTVSQVPYAPADTQVLETLTVNTTRTEYGGLEVNGNDVYVCWEDKMYIVKIGTSSTLSSTTTLSSSTVYANDIKVAGKYAYILVNYPSDLKGAVQVYDIRNTISPFLCSETKETSLRNSSRLAIHGKNIYVVSSTTGSKASLVSLDLHGISSPSAEIGSLLTSDFHVSNSATIRNNLHVKNSINVGPGGVFIDRGFGLVSDGQITSNISIDGDNIIVGGITVIANGLSQSAPSTGNMYTRTNVLQDINIYDSLNLDLTYLVNNGSVKYIRGGFVGNQILRLLGTQYYGEASAPLPNAFIGSQILLGYFGAVDRVYGDFIGHNIDLGSGFQLQANQAYGYKFRFAGSSSGTVYGLHIEGADENLVEGNLQAADSIQAGSSSKIKNEWHGFINLGYNTSGSPGGIGAGYEITSANISSSGLDQKGFSIPTLSPAHTCGTGNANSGIGSSEVILKGSLKINTPTFSNVNNVVVHLTPRYAGSDESLLLSYIGQVNTVSDLNIYWRSITDQSAFNSSDNISFNISIYEYDNN